MSQDTVTKYNGKQALRENCRKIHGEYYEINVDCFRVDGKWNRINNGLIVKDHETNTWHNAKRLTENRTHLFGLVGVENGTPLLGYFSPSNKNVKIYCEKEIAFDGENDSVYIYKNKTLTRCKFIENTKIKPELQKNSLNVLDSSLVKDFGLVKALSTDILVPTPDVDKKFSRFFKKDLGPGYGNLNYNSDNTLDTALQKFERFYSPSKNINNFRNYARLLEGLTFGIEFETSNGYVPKDKVEKLGLIPLKDGSLRKPNGDEPYEFATVPFSGTKGISALHDIMNELSYHCEIDSKCSLHIHFSGLPVNKRFAVSLMSLTTKLQDDIFKMFPYYKTEDPEGRKNYCKKFSKNDFLISKLPNKKANKDQLEDYINNNFAKIFNFASCGHNVGHEFNIVNAQHPINQAKWHIGSRYYWINIVPFLFKKSRTVEFRLHSATLNRAKVFNWMLICNAILRYAERRPLEILRKTGNYNVEDIISVIYGDNEQVAEHLKQYIVHRKNYFAKATDDCDYYGVDDIENDANYTFESNIGITDIELDI